MKCVAGYDSGNRIQEQIMELRIPMRLPLLGREGKFVRNWEREPSFTSSFL